jgi:pyruvate formate lyase activating enzyme
MAGENALCFPMEVKSEMEAGVPNKVFIRNLRNLDDKGKSNFIRLPLIPGLTESDANIQETAILFYLSGLKHIERIDLMPYREDRRIKYEQ